jgi:hypothetical protein
MRKARATEERDSFFSLCGKTPVCQPNEQIEDCGRAREYFDCLKVCGNGMFGDFSIELIA